MSEQTKIVIKHPDQRRSWKQAKMIFRLGMEKFNDKAKASELSNSVKTKGEAHLLITQLQS